jgi:Acetyltransferase (GNAT) domain
MDVIVLDQRWEEGYERFLLQRPDSLLYSSLKYRAFLKALLGCTDQYLLAVDQGRIEGVLPLMKLQADGKIVYNSLPYYGSNGGVIAASSAAAETLVQAYNDLVSQPNVAAATVVPNPFESAVAGYSRTHEDVRIAQWIDLKAKDEDLETFLARIDSSARRNVRKALAEGVTVRRDERQLRVLRDMHVRNMASIGGRAKTDAFFELVPQHFVAGRDWDLYVGELDGRTIAALLVFYYGRTVEYFTPAVEESFREMQALPLIIAQAVGDAARRGLTRWNFGATWESQTGVYRFKKKWAAQEKRYSYSTYIGDADLLKHSSAELLEMYPNFYVVPFSALGKEAAA